MARPRHKEIKTSAAILALIEDVIRADREQLRKKLRAIPSYTGNELVPNTGPDVVTRDAVFGILDIP